MSGGLMGDTGFSNAEISRIWKLSPIVPTMTPPTGTVHQITLLSTYEANCVLPPTTQLCPVLANMGRDGWVIPLETSCVLYFDYQTIAQTYLLAGVRYERI